MPLTRALFSEPSAIAIGPQGEIYVTETAANTGRVRKLTL